MKYCIMVLRQVFLGVVSDNVMSFKFRKSNAKYIYVKNINGINVTTLKSMAANIVARV